MIGPRLTDPRSKTDEFIQIFRYAEDKAKVEEILKARQQSLASSMFKVGTTSGGGRGETAAGRGGRGSGLTVVRPGRGSPAGGRGIVTSPKPETVIISELNTSNDVSIKSVLQFVQPTSEVMQDTHVEMWEQLVKNENVIESNDVSELDCEGDIRGSVTVRPFSIKICSDDIKSIRNAMNNITLSNNNDNINDSHVKSIDTDGIVSVIEHTSDIIGTATINVVDTIQSGRKSRRFSKFLPENNDMQLDAVLANTDIIIEPEVTPLNIDKIDKGVLENPSKEISASFNSRRESVRASPVSIKLLKEKYLATGTDGSVIVVSNNSTASSSSSSSSTTITVPKRRNTYLLSNESNSNSSNNTSSEEQKSDKTLIIDNTKPLNSDFVDLSGSYKIYSYDVLVERNRLKMYDGLCQSDLELHLDDTEFLNKFGTTKEEYNKLPKWRKIAQKKALLLF